MEKICSGESKTYKDIKASKRRFDLYLIGKMKGLCDG